MFKDIKKLLPWSVIRAGIGGRVEGAGIIKIFAAVADALLAENNISGRIKPLYIKEKTLVATSLSSAVVNFLEERKADIVAEVNKRAGKNSLDNIKYIG